ncbi:MAG: FAD-dependent 5-carboxymethylaminomethyl-2-thiouridine(34) oxidoreductase MnmC [Pseudomonadota bacterium]
MFEEDGSIFVRLSDDFKTRKAPDFKIFLQSYIHAATIAARLPAGVFNPCGVLLKAQTPEDRVRFQKIAAGGLAPKDWLHCRDDGLFFPQAGIIDPKRYVDALLGDAPVIRERVISVTCGDSANTLDVKTDKDRYQDYKAIIFANSVEASRSVGGDALGLSGVAGQIDIFPDASPPDHGVAFGPYAGPAPARGLVIGATYEKLASGAAAIVTAAATASNIKAVSEGAPDVADRLETSKAESRASVRCQTPDRLPVVGPMPDWAFFAENYAGLTKGQRAQGRGGAYPPARYQPGVFVLAGLGSRGLVTAPLCAEVIASLATGAPLPVAADVADALHPARFCIRALKRGR